MALQDIYFIAEILAAGAVIASLIFVGIQVRQNTGTMKVSAGNVAVENWIHLGKEISLNGDFADIYHRGKSNFPGDLQPIEIERFMFWFITTLKSAELSYLHWLDGNLDDRLWLGIDQGVRIVLSFPGHQSLWDSGDIQGFSPQFGTYLNDLLREIRSSEA
jgi:hypothetical protein